MTTTEIVKNLCSHILDVELLKKISKDFNKDFQELLISQIITILSSQDPQYEIKTDAFDNEELVMKITPNQIYNLCKSSIDEITNFDLLAKKLLEFIKKINYYFYELYLCVIDILKNINNLPKSMELWSSILLFLKHKMVKKRKFKPGKNQTETDYWLKLQQNAGVLPKIAKYRFPFIPLIENLKNILDEELSVDSCESWFPLIQFHCSLKGINSESEINNTLEYFCIQAVRNSTLQNWQIINDQTKNEEWHLNPVNNELLQSVLRLVTHIKDLSKVLFVLYFITNYAPDGIDQVQCSYECYKFAIENEEILLKNPQTHEFISKIKRKYPIFKTQHLLHVYGLVEEKLLQLLEDPKELIYALYNHESILKTTKPDINIIAEEISKLYNFNFQGIQMSLLNKWLALSVESNAIDLEETFCPVNDNSINSNFDVINYEYVIRASYILRSWGSKNAINFLIGHIFPKYESENTGKQLQNLECFIKLLDESTISFIKFINQKQYMILKCVHFLNQLGHNFTIKKFEDYDKIQILTKVWQSHASYNPVALEVMVYICLSYDIYIPQIWNGILKQMIQFKMLKQLDALVEILSSKPSLVFIENLSLAWDFVLKTPFINSNKINSNQQEDLLNLTLYRIQNCPLLENLDFVEITKHCMRIQKTHMAVILFVLSPQNKKEELKKIINFNVDQNNIKEKVLKLEECGILPSVINFAIQEFNL